MGGITAPNQPNLIRKSPKLPLACFRTLTKMVVVKANYYCTWWVYCALNGTMTSGMMWVLWWCNSVHNAPMIVFARCPPSWFKTI
eukprot:scaffold99528_cov56-Cyclotella_meneghiniana.AAC.4